MTKSAEAINEGIRQQAKLKGGFNITMFSETEKKRETTKIQLIKIFKNT
jgi:hypothetical protein